MIRRLGLRNWRAYESASIPFEPGTTFIVAPNGIGKTSLLEAARFALTGDRSGLSSPVQLDADEAEVELTLQLPAARVLLIRRVLYADPAKVPTFEATLGDKSFSERDLAAELEATLGATPEFIGRTALLCDSLRDNPDLDLRSQLARAFDLEAKRSDAAHLRALEADLEAEAKALSRALKTEAKEMGRLEEQLEAARADVVNSESALDEKRSRLDEIAERRQAFMESEVASERLHAWDESISTVVDAAREHLPDATADGLAAQVEDLVRDTEQELVAIQGQLAALKARVELIESALADLSSAGPDCPVCLRPMTDHDRESAAAAHRAERTRLEAELEPTELDAAASRVQAARQLMRQVDGLGQRPSVPALVAASDVHPQEEYDNARADLEGAAATHSTAVARVTQLADALEDAQVAEERTAQSVTAWRRWALTSAAASTLTDSIDEVLSNEIEPIAAAVGERWNSLFADRPDLHFDLEGSLWRDLRGHRLAVDAFSAGERIAARLLMQLAILTSATTVDFCWVDEPLEHLDPTTRRLVAGMLSHGRAAIGLRQLVVTTYEEELAQRLADSDESTTIQYVRAGRGSS